MTMTPHLRKLVLLALLVAIARPGFVAAQTRLDPAGIDGTLLLGGGGKLPDAVLERFVELAGGPTANLVILAGQAEAERVQQLWKAKSTSVTVVPVPPGRTDPAPAALETARGVWIEGGNPAVLGESATGKGLAAVLARGGVVGANGDEAAVLAQRFLQTDGKAANAGLGLLPGVLLADRSQQAQLLQALEKQPGLIGVTIDAGSALLVRGRQLHVVGDGTVTAALARTPTRGPRTLILKGKDVGDLTALRRAASARAAAPFPPREAPVPQVAGGSLLIVGGGGMPADVTKRFIDLAGGPEALIVVLPTASPDPVPLAEGEFLRRAGAKNIKVLPGRKLADVDGPESLAALEKAGGIWFGGGRQWRFVDAYEGTKALDLMHGVLKRGGVIGGSSAGATIQGDYLCRGSPFGNLEIMYEGYERGLAFLPGVAIDQHFAQRKRFADMTELVKTYPQLLGIGIDETTALVVQGHVAEVMGKNQVHFYNRRRLLADGQPDYESVKTGERYDLKARRVLAGKD